MNARHAKRSKPFDATLRRALETMRRIRQTFAALAGLALFTLILFQVPHRWCGRDAHRWYAGDLDVRQQLARTVEHQIKAGVDLGDFTTGSSQFNGEWLFGTYLMAGIGFAQLIEQHPDLREHYLPLIGMCIERMLTEEVRRFDRMTWDQDPVDALGTHNDHAAYLGYFNLLLGLHRKLDPSSPHADLHDRITQHLVNRVRSTPGMLLQSYPEEIYPVDNCAVIGSIGLYDRATGADHRELLRAWAEACRAHWIDRQTGLLIQSMAIGGLTPADDPRGSGTSLGLYFLSFADAALAHDLCKGVKQSLATTFLGFGAVREYPRHLSEGLGDIDSGPIVLGFGLSATGFTIAGSRMFGDEAYFRRLYASAHFAGAPRRSDDRLNFVTGGPLGNAILLAMLTAPRVEDTP